MEKLYRITPLEKKSVEYFVDVYETNVQPYDNEVE